MKKRAIKGLVALAVVVALCMFFSGTIKTITTPKVKLVTAKQGKLEETIKLSGQLMFPKTEDIKLPGLTGDQAVTISRVRVAKGRKVEAGDVLFEAEVSGFDKQMETLRGEADEIQKEIFDLQRKNGDLRLKRTEEIYMEAYDQLADSREELLEAQTALEVAAKLAGVTLKSGKLPEEAQADEALASLQKDVEEAEKVESEAQKRFNNANRLGISEDVLTYVTKSRELKDQLSKKQDQITALTVLGQQAAKVTAPHEGYIVDVVIKAGESYDGRSAAVVMSAQDQKPVLRADTNDIERKIEKGTEIVIKRDSGKNVNKKVSDSGVDEEGKRYVDVELSDKDVSNLGGGAALLAQPVNMSASYRAGSSTTLLPVSAVRGSGDSRYVYAVDEEMSALGERVLKVRKMDVKVLAEVGATVSIETDLGRQRVAYMEDRAISEGSEVMVYPE